MNNKCSIWIFSFVLILFIQSSLFSQRKKHERNQLIQIENRILQENVDQVGMELINDFNDARKDLKNHKIEAFKTYDKNMSVKEKSKLYRKTFYGSDELLDLQDELQKRRKKKVEYLSANYQAYQQSKLPVSAISKFQPAQRTIN